MRVQSPAFDLIKEPWIPCLRPDGSVEQVGLKEALTRSSEFLAVVGETPLVTASMYRLLLAVLHRVVDGPQTADDWISLWQSERLDPGRVNAYFRKWSDRFYLFHPDHPFYQWPDDRVDQKSIRILRGEFSHGENATLFDHSTKERSTKWPPAVAARALLSAQNFGVAGSCHPKLKLYFSHSPLAKGVFFLLGGNSLFQTLLFNLLPYAYIEDRFMGFGLPVWEVDNPFMSNRSVPLGYLDYLTWPSRKIMLLPEKDTSGYFVEHVTISPGLSLPDHIFDPMKHFISSRSKGWTVTRFQENRALWRDSAVLLELKDRSAVKAPVGFHLMADMIAEYGVLPEDIEFRIIALGMAAGPIDSERKAKAGKIHFYRHETMSLPGKYFEDRDLLLKLSGALEKAETLGRSLNIAAYHFALFTIAPRYVDKDLTKVKIDKLSRDAAGDVLSHWAVGRRYWTSLEIHFHKLLRDLPNGDAALERWNEALVRSSRESFDYVERHMSGSVRFWHAAVRPRRELESKLRKLFM